MEKTKKTITFGGESYPKNNTAVVMIGEAGTNKKEVAEKMMEINGEVFSTERALEEALRSEKAKKKLMQSGFNLNILDMKDPKNITDVYNKLESMGEIKAGIPNDLSSKIMLGDKKNKPNLIYIDTVRDSINFYNLISSLLGSFKKYEKKDIHVVWVIEDYEEINSGVISDTDFKITNDGCGNLMSNILNGTLNLSEYMDGDIWLVLGEHDIIQIKKAGSSIDDNKFNDRILNLINERVPYIQGKYLLNKRKHADGTWKDIEKKTPTIQEFLLDVSCNDMLGSDAIFTTSIDGDSYEVAKIKGFEGNISNWVNNKEYDSVDLNNFKSELTHFIVDAINEKLEKEK